MLNLSRIWCVATLEHHFFSLFRAPADGKCSESTSCSNATATADRPIYIDNANNRKKLHKGPKSRSKSKYRESRSRSRELRSRSTNRIFKNENDNYNDIKSKNLRTRITDESFELSNGIDNQLKANRIERFNIADDFLQRLLKQIINKKRNRFLKNINKSQSFLKKRIQQNSNLKRKSVRKNFLLLKKDIREKVSFDKRSYRQSIIFKKKEDIYIKKILRKNIKKYSLFLKKYIHSKALFIDKSYRQILILIKKDICENALNNKIQAKELSTEINNQQRSIIAKKYNLYSPLFKKKGINDEDKSISLPKREKSEKNLLLKINFKKQSIHKNDEKDLLSTKGNIHKDLTNTISQLTIKDIRETTLFSKKYIRKNPQSLIKKYVNDSPEKNISIDPLMQLMDKPTQKEPKSSKYIFNEKILVKTDSEEDSQRSVCVKKNSLLSQRKNILDDTKLTSQIKNNSLLTKDFVSLTQKEKDIPENLQLIENNVQGNSLLTKNIFSLTRKIIFSSNRDISSIEEEKHIFEKDLPTKLKKGTIQNYFFLTKKFCSLNREDISLIEKKKTLSQSTKRTIYKCLSLNKNLKFKQTKDLIDFPHQSSIVHCRHNLLSKVPQQILQKSKKIWEKRNRESYYKAKRSPPPEEGWLSQGSTGFDNDGSTDKDDSSIAKCRLTDSYHYTKHQLIVKPPEVHITISKISSCPKQLADSSKGGSEGNFIAESIESVSRCTNFEEDLKYLKDQIIKIEDPEKIFKIPTIKVNRGKILKKPIVEIKDFEEILKDPIVGIKNREKTSTSQDIKANSNDLFILKINDHLEDSNYQRIIQKNSQLCNRINHQSVKFADRRLSLIINSSKSRENILKYPSIKIEELVDKIYTDNSPGLKIINNLECLNNQRIIQKSYLVDHQSDDVQLPIVGRKLLGSNRRSESIGRFHKNFKMKLTIRLIRIRDKLVLGLSAFAIVFTLLLVMDLQMDLGYSGHHLTPSHARVRVGDPPNADSVYNNFRRKFLQRGNGSREQANGDTTPVIEKSGKNELISSSSTMRKHDDFADLTDLVANGYAMNIDEGVAIIDRENREYNPTIGELKKVIPR